MRPSRISLVLSLVLTLPALAADPPIDLAPLVPPKAPWMAKKVKKAPGATQKKGPRKPAQPADKPAGAAKSSVAQKNPGARTPGARKKKGVAAQEPALELLPLVPLGPAAPARPATLPSAAAPLVAAPPASVAPAPPAASAAALPPPPLLKLSNRIGVLVQADTAQAALESGLQAIAALAPLSQHPRVLPRPAQRCGDDACALELARSLDELVVASLQAGQLRLRVLDVGTGQRVGAPQQAAVKDDEAVAAAEAMACRLLVPEGCTGELKLGVAAGTRVEVDGAPVPAAGARLPVGLHALVARSGARSQARTIAIVREAPLSLSLPDAVEPARAPALAAIAGTSPATAPASRGWTRPAGIAVASAGVVAAGLGIYFGASSRSDLGTAETAWRSNGGSYRTGDAATLSAGNSSAHKANLLFAASAVLVSAGAILFFAF